MNQETQIQKTEKISNISFLIYKAAVIGGIVLLTYFTVLAVAEFGYLGIFQYALLNAATRQVFVDLIITIVIKLVWLWHDAKKHNRMFFPWLMLCLVAGVYGVLFYLLFKKRDQF